MMVQIKHFSVKSQLTQNYGWTSLEERINKFLEQPHIVFMDIKYSSTYNGNDNNGDVRYTTGVYEYSALLIYNDTTK